MYRQVKTSKGELIINQELIPNVMSAIGLEPSQYEITPGAWTGTELEGWFTSILGSSASRKLSSAIM